MALGIVAELGCLVDVAEFGLLAEEGHLADEGHLGPNSIETFWLEFWLEKRLEFWLEIPYRSRAQDVAQEMEGK